MVKSSISLYKKHFYISTSVWTFNFVQLYLKLRVKALDAAVYYSGIILSQLLAFFHTWQKNCSVLMDV